MSGTKYNFDEYIFDNVLEDTYLAIKDVRENIDRWAKETREIDFDYNPYEGRDEREKLDRVITKNIVDSIKDRLYNVDFENKVMRGVNVEAVRCVVGNILADYYYDKGCEVAQGVATKIAYSGKDIKDISVQDFYEMTEDIRKDVMAMDDNINELYGDVTLWRRDYYSYDENAKLSERFAGCYELGLLNSDNSAKLNAYLSECLSPTKSLSCLNHALSIPIHHCCLIMLLMLSFKGLTFVDTILRLSVIGISLIERLLRI